MSSVETVDDEFEVGFNQTFEAQWHYAELAGRLLMVVFIVCSALGLLERGPFSHASKSSANGETSVDYEPIARHGTSTMITVHLKKPQQTEQPVRLLVNQQMIDPTGYQHATPRPNHSSVGDAGAWLTFSETAGQQDALLRFEMSPSTVGFIPMHLSDGNDTIDWTMLVVP